MSCSPRFSVRDLRYAYPDGTCALNGVTFDMLPGEAVALVGGNGAGKSTLLLHLGGCLAAAESAFLLDGVPASTKNLETVRKRVGMVFQNPDDQLFMPTVYDDVAFGPLNMGLSSDEVDARVRDALATVGGAHLATRQPHRLSGGEKRLVAIACVLSMQPHVLILDEPTSNLDPRARRQFINLMRSFDHTRLIASHDLEMVLELCPRTLILRDGVICADGPTLELFSDDALLEASHLERPASLAR